MFDEAKKILDDINYTVIKRAIIQLKRKQLISYKRRHLKKTITITQEGRQRLAKLFPTYKTRRTWDKRIYLITYDIPQNRKNNRELLRSYIKRLGAAMLQESVWLTPYNPREILRSFLEERNLSEVVIVSDLGTDAIIGDENLKVLIAKIYKLEKLNKRYKDYVQTCQNQTKPLLWGASLYLSILRDDPQLPFALLPNDWHGDEAYELAKSIYLKLHL